MSGSFTIYLLVAGLGILATLVVFITAVTRRASVDRDIQARVGDREITPEERSEHRATEKIWVLLLLGALALAVGLYVIF